MVYISLIFKMGGTTSTEQKAVDATGQVNNSVVVEENPMQLSEWLLLIICIVHILQLIIYIKNTYTVERKDTQSKA